MKRRTPLIVLAMGLVAAVLIWWVQHRDDSPSGEGIRVSGHIEAREVDLGFKIPGRVLRILVDEGEAVQEGQLVAVLDDRELREELQGAVASLHEAKSRIPQIESRIRQQTESTRAREAHAQAALETARAELRELLAGSRPQEIRQAEADLEAAKADLEKSREDFLRAENLLRRAIIPQRDWDHAKAAYDMARERYRAAMARLALAREGPRLERIEAARAKVRLAEAEVQLASTGWLEVERLQRELDTVKAQVERAAANARLAETRAAEARLRAPLAGIGLVRDAEEGEVLPAGTPVLTVGDLADVWLEAYIREEELGRVQPGQRVKVTTDTFPEKAYEGRLSFISDEAEFTPKNVQTHKERVKLVYRIKVALSNPRGELRPGMPADGLIVLAKGESPASTSEADPSSSSR